MEYTFFVDLSSWFFVAFVASTIMGSIASSILEWLNSEKGNIKTRIRDIHSLGDLAKRLFPLKAVSRALRYKQTNDRFENMVDSIKSGLSLVVVMFGIPPFMVYCIHETFPSIEMVWCYIISLCISAIATSLAFLPASYYSTFSIEERFGFNTSTKKTFFADAVKGLAVAAAVIAAYQLILNWLLLRFSSYNAYGIILCIVAVVAVGKVLQWMFVNCIMPMFNKFEPLKDERLKSKMVGLCGRCGFKVSGIYVMDASKRSKHSNAFICGSFGKNKIVLFDNLLENMTHDEILSIVAHEIGHGKLHHLMFKNVASILQIAFGVTVAFVLMKCESFYHAFGYSWVDNGNIADNMIIGFNLSVMFAMAFTWILSPFSCWLSRRMEYAADRYSVEHTRNKKSLSNALLKLTAENLSDIFPHPAYEFATYSHPSIVNRIRAIRENGR